MIAEMTDVIKDRIAFVSPWMNCIDHLGGRIDEHLFRMLVDFSRDWALDVAEKAQITDPLEYEFLVDNLDDDVYELGQTILRTPPLTSGLMSFTRLRERGSVGRMLDSLVTHMELK